MTRPTEQITAWLGAAVDGMARSGGPVTQKLP